MCDTYNGYANYQTWNVSLWINNDEGLYNHFQALAREAIEKTAGVLQAEWRGYSVDESRTAWLSNRIEEEISEANPVSGYATLWSDLMGHSLAAVDWYEIAENLLEEQGYLSHEEEAKNA